MKEDYFSLEQLKMNMDEEAKKRVFHLSELQ